jgi:uncharacterized protein YecE (DUF72 family)
MLHVGTGGWAYFRVPGTSSLRAYSSAFDFVEVNSTYYSHPNPRTVSLWRKVVPADFDFSVRCHRSIVDALTSKRGAQVSDVVGRMERTCKILRASVLVVLLPTDRVAPSQQDKGVRELLSTFSADGTRVAVEFRGGPPGDDVLEIMKEGEAVHSVDISREEPKYESDILYSRLFGKGQENIYEFDDEELQSIALKASAPKFEKSILAFHGVRMYRDGARLKAFLRTGDFPMVTGQAGLDSLRSVLAEDTKFPTSKAELVSLQGWKLFDASPRQRARAAGPLSRLPEGTYRSLDSVISTLRNLPLVNNPAQSPSA